MTTEGEFVLVGCCCLTAITIVHLSVLLWLSIHVQQEEGIEMDS